MSQPTAALRDVAAQLAALSATGLADPPTIYERDNFREAGAIAAGLRALLDQGALDDFQSLDVPPPAARGPVAVGDAAIIDDAGRLLLIRRADNHNWALPGGALEVGESAADGVVREAREEAGVVAVPHAFIALHVTDHRRDGRVIRLFHNLFLCRPVGTVPAYHAHEIIDSGWFTRDALPAPLDPHHAHRIPVAFAAWDGSHAAYFDA